MTATPFTAPAATNGNLPERTTHRNRAQARAPAKRLSYTSLMSSKLKRSFRSLAIIAIVAIVAYFAHTEYQSHLGRKALDATGLEMRSLDQALAISKETGKPVLADLSAIWCPSCRRLDETVLAHDSGEIENRNGLHFRPHRVRNRRRTSLHAKTRSPRIPQFAHLG